VSIPRVKDVIRRVLEDKMAITLEKEPGKKDKHVWNYDHEEVGEIAREACEAIQQAVKGMRAQRHARTWPPPPRGRRTIALRARVAHRSRPPRARGLACADLGYGRYKLLVQVQMGENNGQALRTASRCLWAPESDVSVSGSFVKGRMFATATVFCLYHE
jgi:hypothetical protein